MLATARLLIALASCCAFGAAAPAEGASPRLTLGIAENPFSGTPSADDPWLGRTVATGTDMTLLGLGWSGIAPVTRPEGFNAADPASPGYRWDHLDGTVRLLSASGIRIGVTFTYAPKWATGRGAPEGTRPGAWRPSTRAFGQFARALGRRYNGSFPDPADPSRTLPRIDVFQPWSEPNLDTHLAPQWTRKGSGYRPASPGIYRGLLNAFHEGVKAEHPQATVVTAGTAPFGDADAGGMRMQPVRFVRELLCLRGPALKRARCKRPARFDVLAHHPYSVGGPNRKALNADDVSIPDLHKLTRVLRRAERTGRALPRKRHRLWVTEFSWDSNPPDPQGVPDGTRARWLAEAFHSMWRQGVDNIVWLSLRDSPGPDFASSYQAGLYLRDGEAKTASLRSFRFPFFPRRRGGTVSVWGRAPADGDVAIQRDTGSGWRTVATVPRTRGQIFQRRVAVPRRGRVRAVQDGVESPVWRP
jgi:hypothetical protein